MRPTARFPCHPPDQIMQTLIDLRGNVTGGSCYRVASLRNRSALTLRSPPVRFWTPAAYIFSTMDLKRPLASAA